MVFRTNRTVLETLRLSFQRLPGLRIELSLSFRAMSTLSCPTLRTVLLALTPGQTHDSHGAALLLNDLASANVLLADKAYDADWIRDVVEAQGAAPNIPDRRNRKQPIGHFN